MLRDDEQALIRARGKRYLPTGSKSRVLRALGLREAHELAPAWCALDGSGTGLSGLATVHVSVYRTGDPWGQDAEILPE